MSEIAGAPLPILPAPTLDELRIYARDFIGSDRFSLEQVFFVPGFIEYLTQERLRLVEGVEVLNEDQGGSGIADHALTHNINGLLRGDALSRPMLLMNPLRSVQNIMHNREKMRVLLIGPRSEAEIFYAWTLGIPSQNITAVDIIRYSELVTLGDMHALPFEDNSFDLIVAGWVLAYSRDNCRAVQECGRVLRQEGYLAIGCVAEPYSLLTENPDVRAKLERSIVGGIPMTSNDPERPGNTKTVSRFFYISQILRLVNEYMPSEKKLRDVFVDVRYDRETERSDFLYIGRAAPWLT